MSHRNNYCSYKGEPFRRPSSTPANHPMPQIDFGRAFSNSDKPATSSPSEETAETRRAELSLESVGHGAPVRFHRAHMGYAEWTNIVFATIASLGGLFCAFYFFGATEVLRTATSWPREYLYPRPESSAEDSERSRLAASLGLPTPNDGKAIGGSSGDPFSRTGDLISLNPPNSRLARGVSSSGSSPESSTALGGPAGLPGSVSPLSRLGLPAPGGDGLTQALNKAVSELQRAARMDAKRTVRVVRTVVEREEKRVDRRSRNPAKCAPVTVAQAAGRVLARGERAQQTASSVSSSVSSNSQTLSSARNGLGGTRGGELSRLRGGLGSAGGGLGGHTRMGRIGGGRGH